MAAQTEVHIVEGAIARGPRRRSWRSGFVLVVLGLVALATAIGIVSAWRHYSDDAVRWTAVAGVAPVGGFILAVLAAGVAVQAYRQALRNPLLTADVMDIDHNGLRYRIGDGPLR